MIPQLWKATDQSGNVFFLIEAETKEEAEEKVMKYDDRIDKSDFDDQIVVSKLRAFKDARLIT